MKITLTGELGVIKEDHIQIYKKKKAEEKYDKAEDLKNMIKKAIDRIYPNENSESIFQQLLED